MNYVSTALGLLPDRLCPGRGRYLKLPIEEIRLRTGRIPMAFIDGEERSLSDTPLEQHDIMRVLEKATGASLHTAMPALCGGYISFKGIRIGVCGTAVVKNGAVSGFRCFSSVNIRIPAEFTGDIDGILPEINAGGFSNTLIISPPGGGKTTVLREIIRRLSESGRRISVIDERCELSATDGTEPGFDLGAHSDVMLGMKKNPGALMMLRGMNPEIIAMDEITEIEDIMAIREVSGCGVGILATAHAASAEAMKKRELYRQLLDEHIFEYAVEIDGTGRERRYICRRLEV